MIKFLAPLTLLLCFQGAWAAPQLERIWARKTLIKPYFQFRHFNRMSPILTDKLVIQGNPIDGIKAFDRSSGQEKWTLSFKNGVEGGAALSGDKVYFGANNGQFYCVNTSDGSIVWSQPLHSESLTAPLVQGGYVFHLTGNNTLHALDAKTGRSLWVKTKPVKAVMTIRTQTKPVFDNGRIYVGFSDGHFSAFNAESGREIWSKRIGDDKKFNDVDATAVVTPKCVLVSSYANALYCLDKNSGSILWRHDHGGFNAVLAHKGKIYYPTGAGEIHVLDAPSGKLLKRILIKKGLATEVIAYKDWLIYGESGGSVVLRNKNTLATQARFFPGRGLFAKPTLDSEKGEIYIQSNDANLFKLKVSTDKVKPFPWSE